METYFGRSSPFIAPCFTRVSPTPNPPPRSASAPASGTQSQRNSGASEMSFTEILRNTTAALDTPTVISAEVPTSEDNSNNARIVSITRNTEQGQGDEDFPPQDNIQMISL